MKYLSLKYKLLFFSIGLSIILTVCLSGFELNYDTRKYRKNLIEDLYYFEKAHQLYLSEKLWTMEYDSLRVFAENEVGEKLISRVKIVDARNKVVAEADELTSRSVIERKFDLTYFHNGKKTMIGRAYISGGVPSFYQMLESRWSALLVVNGVFVAVIFFSSYLLFYRNVLNRLFNIITFMDGQPVSKGEGQRELIPCGQSTPDEITLLINSLNDRTKRIYEELSKRKQAESQLKEKNRELLKEIEERIQTQSALKVSQQTFLSVLDGIDATIYVSDMQTYEVLFVNKFMIKSFGNNLIGKKCWEVFRGEKGPCENCTNNRILNSKGEPSGVYVWQGKNPITNRWYINYDRAIRWHDGRLVRLQIATDITEFKKMEEDLRQSHKMESIGTLAGGVAHDFNNILSIIIGNTELALEDVPDWNPAYKNIQEIKTASFRAREVVKQLLSYSRKNKEELKPVDIAPIVKESLQLVRSTIPVSIDIIDHIPDTSEFVLADATQINQVVINLCANAAHAMPNEKGRIDVSIQSVDIHQTTGLGKEIIKPGKYLKLSIKDNGSGIDKENIDRVFDPYFTTKETGKGTGMGLAVVHGIIKSHNGYINIKSGIGEGTVVSIFLPVSGAKISDKLLSEERRPYAGSERILFIDDEEPIVRLVEQSLQRLGYMVCAETDPIVAFERFKSSQDQFDLIISDMTMPFMSGVELTEKIKEIRSDIPIVICTGFSSLMDAQESKKMGIDAFLVKPVSIKELSETIRLIMNK